MAVAVAELDVTLAALGDGDDDALAAGAGLNHCSRSMNVVRIAVGASQMAACNDNGSKTSEPARVGPTL